MKVEIDADELCMLRKAAKEAGSRSKTKGGMSAWEYFQNLCESQRQRRELEEERDWWRDKAFCNAANWDALHGNITYAMSSLDDGNASERLAQWANSEGYEVPE